MSHYLTELLERAVKEGELRPFQDEKERSYVSYILISITETLFLVKDQKLPLNPNNLPLEEVLDNLVQFVLSHFLTREEEA